MDESSTSSETRRFLRHPTELGWSDFVDRYGPRILTWCRRKRLDRDACEDVAQDVLKRLHSYMHTYKEEQSFRGWLYQVAHNAAFDYIKDRQKVGIQLPDGFQDFAVGEGGIAEYIAEKDALTIALERTRLQVGATEWTTFELFVLRQVDYDQIEQQLQLARPTLMNYVSKVRGIIAQELQKLDED